MGRLSLLVAAVYSCGGAHATFCPAAGDGWTTVDLDPAISYVAHHKVEGSTLHLRLRAESNGWLGFGFAEPSVGHMKGSDMVTAYVNNDVVHAQDRYADFAAVRR